MGPQHHNIEYILQVQERASGRRLTRLHRWHIDRAKDGWAGGGPPCKNVQFLHTCVCECVCACLHMRAGWRLMDGQRRVGAGWRLSGQKAG